MINEDQKSQDHKVASGDDQYLCIRSLSSYSDLAVPTLRDYIRSGNLPCFKVKGKLLIKRSEFDRWLENFRVKNNINDLVDGVMKDLNN